MLKVRKMTALLMALCLTVSGMACLTACGSAGGAQGSASASASAEPEAGLISSYAFPSEVSADMPDGMYNVSLGVPNMEGNEVDVTFFAYDTYDIVEIAQMEVGDRIQFKGEEITVESIDSTANNIMSINGGLEQGGFDLISDEDTNGWRTLQWDDYPEYFQVGEAQKITISPDVVLTDAYGGEPQDEPVASSGEEAIAFMQDNSPEDWNCYSTRITIEGGVITAVDRIWVP